MIVAKIKVDGVCAVAEYRKLIPAGIIGAQMQINYAPDIWQGLHKTVVFNGAVTKDVITDAEVVTIPAEVVAKHGYPLRVGVYGVDADGNIAIPTIWADLGTVRDAADPSGDTTTDPSLPVWEQIQAMIGNLDDLDTTAKNNLVAAVNEAMTKGGGTVDETDVRRIVEDYLAAHPPTVTESDPTVPAWAKQPTKPAYTAAEVGALPYTYTPPNQTAQQVGADPAGTAASAVFQHNTDATAHNDIRLAMQELANRINAALDSDDTTLDQMSEVVAYIKSNKSLIDAITTSKVSVADIVNDLVTNVTDKPLSAAQGVVIKTLIDALRNDKLDSAELTNAVNTALAQAKESGEFDGQDGATPNIQIGTVETLAAGSPATASVTGTPENPLLNLGIPQGASGSGGSGISVTGATVGQTVKIAAVGDDGVPTAWEPVDFPSGGGSCKHIETITIPDDEEIAVITFTIPAKTRKLYVLGRTNTTSTFGTAVRPYVKNGNTVLAVLNISLSMDHRKALFVAELYDDIQFMAFSSSNSSFTAAYPGAESFYDYASYFYAENNTFNIVIQSASSNQYFAPGCTFALYALCEE